MWASGNWSDARSKADEFRSRQQDLRKLDPEETRRVVTAICEAEEDARKDAGRDASERVAREVNDKMSELERLRNDANKLLDDVINDDNLKGNRDDAKRLKEDVATRWDSIERMSRSLRGANHPVVRSCSIRDSERTRTGSTIAMPARYRSRAAGPTA